MSRSSATPDRPTDRLAGAPADGPAGAPADSPAGDPAEPAELAAAVVEEQQFLDVMYDRLADMRSDAVRRLGDARYSSDGTPAGRFNRDALQHRYSQEVAALTAAEDTLCFGRLDRAVGPADPGTGTDGLDADEAILHIGRMGLTDGTRERRQILIDWRAPSAAPFYTATALAPHGVIRRRHLQTRRRRVLSVADEYLQAAPGVDPADVGDALGSAGDSALLAALNAPRTGRMLDIIATIQGEQDRIIRSDRSGVLVVQGGPGTGKTVVALHRAAYLLYTHRERLGSHGVLVVGPNATFLDYIGQVLPSLGESSVVLSTIGTLFPGVVGRPTDLPVAAELKGRPMMAAVIDNAILDRQRMPKRARVFGYDRGTLRLEPGMLAKAQRQAWGSRLPHNKARQVFLRVVLDGLARQIAGRPGVRQLDEAPKVDHSAVRKELAADADVVAALADLWPALTPEQLIGDLLTDQRRLEFAARSLTAKQRDALLRTDPQAWTEGDVPLLDEAAELLGDIGAADLAWSKQQAEDLRFAQESLEAMGAGSEEQAESGIGFTLGMLSAEDLVELHTEDRFAFTTADRAAADREWTYGHVIVDEAQELSQMAWRMLMRRCPVKSMTVVGDIAQTSNPAGATGWARSLRPHVGDRWRLAELTVNYRTPAEIMDVAAGVLARIDPELAPPTSVRESGFAPWARRVPRRELAAAVAAAAVDEVAQHGAGQLAVLVPDELRASVLAAVTARLPGASGEAGPGHRVTVLTVREVKGLEFDAVLLAEPADMVGQSKRGLGDLYVALTRATQRLGVVHSRALPAGLTIGRPAGDPTEAADADRTGDTDGLVQGTLI
ncbi:HelD family protein [Nakamurella lactea]|uniref:HelD family protein n=1 Tax=Nakamurella lactea TaxID=459515 RepID=UPI0003FAE7C9|nr:AAA family ATPase [Nakamurella lactea]